MANTTISVLAALKLAEVAPIGWDRVGLMALGMWGTELVWHAAKAGYKALRTWATRT